jgi:hypothetical protein
MAQFDAIIWGYLLILNPTIHHIASNGTRLPIDVSHGESLSFNLRSLNPVFAMA